MVSSEVRSSPETILVAMEFWQSSASPQHPWGWGHWTLCHCRNVSTCRNGETLVWCSDHYTSLMTCGSWRGDFLEYVALPSLKHCHTEFSPLVLFQGLASCRFQVHHHFWMGIYHFTDLDFLPSHAFLI